jgi:hypothetical protein
MLSHAVRRVIQVFPSLWCWVWLVSLWEVVSHPSRWFSPGKDRCCGFSKVGMVETVGFHQVMWLVMLKSAKNRILGVDPPGEHVPPRVQYGTACLLIRYVIGCVMLSWVGMAPVYVTRLCDILCELPEPHSAKGATMCRKPQHYKRGHCV